MRLSLSRFQKLLSQRDFHKIYRRGCRFSSSKMIAYYRLGTSFSPKLGVTISKKWGKAHKRNRFKRVVREAYRHVYPYLPPRLELNIHPRPSFDKLTPEELQQEFRRLIRKVDSFS